MVEAITTVDDVNNGDSTEDSEDSDDWQGLNDLRATAAGDGAGEELTLAAGAESSEVWWFVGLGRKWTRGVST